MELPKHYSLHSEEDSHFVVHDKRDGGTFKVAKKGLHPANQIKVMKMRRFADGGEVDETDAVPAALAVNSETPEAPPPLDLSFGLPPPQQTQPMPSQDSELPAAAAEQPIQSQAQAQPTGDILAGLPGMDEARKGLGAQYNAQTNLAKEQQAALQSYQQHMDTIAQEHQRVFAGIDKEQQEYQKQLVDGKIDPHRYFDQMSTGKRIRTAISLLLGGVAAGLTGGPNVALQMMDKAVENDIAAQKSDLGKRESLLNLNMRKYQNASAAEAATRLQYNTALQTQLQAAQAKSTNGVAAAQLHMGLAGLQQQAVKLKAEIAKQVVQTRSLGGGSGEGGLQVGQEPASLLLDPKYREARVEINGKAFQATDKEAAGKVRDVETLAGPVLKSVNDLKALADDPLVRIPGSASNLRAHGIMGDLAVKLPLLSGATIGAKRVNSEEIAHQMERIHDPTQFIQSMGGGKTDQFFRSLEEDVESMRSQHLVGYRGGLHGIKSATPVTGKLKRND